MKRSGFKPRTKPMARGSWSRKDSPLPDTLLRRSRIKSRPKRVTVRGGSKYLAACKNETCFLRLPGVCPLRDPEETIVPAHRNEGKGTGMKVANELTLPACFWCHVEYDQGKRFAREEKRGFWNAGYERWEPVRAAKMGIEMKEAA
ncbi:hypothetical protein VSR68_11265 [Paraburkholderia phymatum]|uniref:hypothetical protein n=1 Tax=Paraburkholderia phymatum TaxID=148447 RepID=UPI00317AFA9D